MPAPFFPSIPPAPPYNVTTPRVLVRWNDVNAQNGPLTRVRGFLTVPPISLNTPQVLTLIAPDSNVYSGSQVFYANKLTIGKSYQWNATSGDVSISPQGGSPYLIASGTFIATNTTAVVQGVNPSTPYFGQLFLITFGVTYTNPIQPSIARRVAQINYAVTSGKSFSIVDLSTFNKLSLNTGWTITIAWATANMPENIITRYILASAGSLDFNVVGALATFPFYFNQAIPSNFCIEVWDMGIGAYTNGVIMPNPINVFSSILGTSDYRYGNDFQIATNNIISPASIAGPVYQFPINFNAIVPIGITPTLPLIKPLSDENFEILTNTPGSELVPNH